MKHTAAAMNHFVTINAPSVGRDASGQPVTGMTQFAQEWANITNLKGLEAIKAGAVTSTVRVSIRLWYRNDLNATMKVVYGDSTYKVLAVLPDLAGKKHVDLVCELDD